MSNSVRAENKLDNVTLTNIAAPDAARHGRVDAKDKKPPSQVMRFGAVREAADEYLFAQTFSDDHEAVGVSLLDSSAFVGIKGWNVIYRAVNFHLDMPVGSDRSEKQFLYAPTARPPNGSCLEVGTAYQTEFGKPTEVYLYAFNFCSRPREFSRWVLVDDAMIGRYAKVDGNNLLYYFRIGPQAIPVSTSATWVAELFNFQMNSWDAFASVSGMSDDKRGWSIFETYFLPGQCSKSLPLLFAAKLEVLNGTSSRWQSLDVTNSLFTSTYDSANPSAYCFHQDSTGPASYVFGLVPKDGGWAVSSTGF